MPQNVAKTPPWWLPLGRPRSTCAPHAPLGSEAALEGTPVKRKMLGCTQSSSTCGSVSMQVALSARPRLEAALQGPPARPACASARESGLLKGCEHSPKKRAPPQSPCKCAPDVGALRGCEGARAESGLQDVHYAGRCTCCSARESLLQRLLDVDRCGLLALARDFEALMAALAARGAPPDASCLPQGGCGSTQVRIRLAALCAQTAELLVLCLLLGEGIHHD